MALFDDFTRLQDTVNSLMGDFGRRSGARTRRGGGGWGSDIGMMDPFLSTGWGMDPFLDTALLGGGITGQQLLPSAGKLGEETKMDESGGAMTTAQGGQLARREVGGVQLPVLRCRVNVEDQKDKYLITAEVPGFDKQNLKVNISDNNVLTINGEQKKEHVEDSKDKRYLRVERSFGQVQRSLQLPRNIKKEAVNASYENGVLHINVPKTEHKEEASNVQIK